MTQPSSNRALVMSGGGAFGAFEAGCVQQITTHDPTRNYDYYAGISVGALNATLLAQYEAFSEGVPVLANMWESIEGHEDVWRWTILGYFQGLVSTGIYDTHPLRQLIDDNLDVERLNASQKCLVFGTTNVLNGSYLEIMKPKGKPLPAFAKQHFIDWIMASAAFPGAFPAIQIKDQLYSDGGLSNAAPITNAINAGYEEIDVLLTGPKDNMIATTIDNVQNVFQLLPQVLVTLFLSVWVQDLYNAYLLNRAREDAGKTPARITVYAPDEPFTYDPLGFNPEEIAAMMAQGRDTQPVSLQAFLYPDGPPKG
jgi:NTE family protein